MILSAATRRLHQRRRGKLEIRSKVPLKTRRDLSLAYTPGVAHISQLIARTPAAARELTIKQNSVAVVTDGSAVLGLGNIGPAAALPVMEGKAILFKAFAGIDAYPICLDTQDTEEIVRVVKAIAPGFGGINLEDISAPRCFIIEQRLQRELNIPVMHDDQHGTAIVVLAALMNAVRVVRKDLKKIRVVINGAGAAAQGIAHLLMLYGISGQKMIVVDRSGIIYQGRKGLTEGKRWLARTTNRARRQGGLREALNGADVFIGVSTADALQPEWVPTMAANPVVFAMANPRPEISLENVKRAKIAVFGTGRSDYPNQINNVLVFPGIFRGALDAKATAITDEMKIAAAEAIARLVTPAKRSSTYIIPNPFDRRVARAVARAVRQTAKKRRS